MSTVFAEVGPVVRDRAARLFDYLHAIRNLRETPIRDLRAYNDRSWHSADLPVHPAVQIAVSDETWLKIRKVDVPEPPAAPEELEPYLAEITPGQRPELLPDLDTRLEQEPWRRRLLQEKLEQFIEEIWFPWAEEARAAYGAKRLYDDLFELRLRLGREEAEVELIWGHGIALWQSGDDVVRHPLIATECRLDFDSDSGEISILAEELPRLEIDIFQGLVDSFDLLVDVRTRFRDEPADPWEAEETTPLYERILNSLGRGGTVEEAGADRSATAQPRVHDSWVILVRRRPTMYAKFF
jgi:hypothetical protein